MQGKNVLNNLPPKEHSLFKQLIKFYETKQYKKGLKQADKILETYPDHPETNSMKGLFLYLTEKQEDGQKLAKLALMKNLKSEICWHIYGIINRNMRNYSEAVKCYQNALRIDPNNGQILKDMSLLQVQIRDFDGLYDTRIKLLQNVPKQPANWIALAVANHLKEDYQETLKVLASFWKIAETELKPFEKSELYLYEAQILEESGNYEGVIALLRKNEKSIVDKISFDEVMVNNLFLLNRPEEALPFVKSLLDLNPENHNYHDLLMKVLNPEDKVAFFDNLLKDYPNSNSIKLRRLHFLNGEAFKTGFKNYITPYYERGQPSLFSEIKSLYNYHEKINLIEEVFFEMEQNANQSMNPCVLLWSFMLLAQHFDYMQNFEKAFDFIEKALKHTPTLIELYLIKAKIYKHVRNFSQADYWANYARKLDLADRYLNNKGIKYNLLNDKIQEADTLIKLFLRDASDGNVHDLQTMWYEIEVGKSHLRKQEFGPGLRQLKFIEKHFNDIYEDQFDFHSYCLRRYTLRAYIQLLRYEENVYQNKTFMKCALNIINGLIDYKDYKLYEEAKKIEEANQEKKKLTPAEKKKMKKEEEKKKLAEENDPNREIKKKLDLDGSKLLAEMKDPLEEAMKFAVKVIDLDMACYKKLGNEILYSCFKLFVMCNRLGLALKALKKIEKLNYDIAYIHDCKIKFVHYAENIFEKSDLNTSLKEIVVEEIKNLKKDKNITEINQEFLDNSSNAKAKLIGLQNKWLLTKNEKKEELWDALLKILKEYKEKEVAINEGYFIYDYLKKEKSLFEKKKIEVQEIFSKLFPLSPYFSDKIEEKVVNNEEVAVQKEEKKQE